MLSQIKPQAPVHWITFLRSFSHWLTLRATTDRLSPFAGLYLKPSAFSSDKQKTHPHLVSEPVPCNASMTFITLGPWLRIVHCNIFRTFTLPEAINLAISTLSHRNLVSEALGVPRNLRVLPTHYKSTSISNNHLTLSGCCSEQSHCG